MPNLNTLGVQPVNIGRIVQCETTRREQIILEKCIENELNNCLKMYRKFINLLNKTPVQ